MCARTTRAPGRHVQAAHGGTSGLVLTQVEALRGFTGQGHTAHCTAVLNSESHFSVYVARTVSSHATVLSQALSSAALFF